MGGSSLNGSMNVNYGFGYFLSANSTMRSSINHIEIIEKLSHNTT